MRRQVDLCFVYPRPGAESRTLAAPPAALAALAALAAPAALAALAALAAGTFWDNFGRQKLAKTSKIGPKPAKASNTIKCGTDFELKL